MKLSAFCKHLLSACAALSALAVSWPRPAVGYVHVVQKGESLAEIAERAYGDPRKESIIVGANALDVHGGSSIVPGMRLQVPAPSYLRVEAGVTWADLARQHLGSEARAGVLALANGAVPWVRPEEGREVVIFPVVSHIAGQGETVATVARKYHLDPERAWHISVYNQRKRPELSPGEVVLVPLVALGLDPAGKRAAMAYYQFALGEAHGEAFSVQHAAGEKIEKLQQALARGAYTDVVALGNGAGEIAQLSREQQAVISRALLEAYVALGHSELAATTCAHFRQVALEDQPEYSFDPAWMSPKVRAACRR